VRAESSDSSDQRQIYDQVRRSRIALRRIRWVVGSIWIGLSVLMLVVFEVFVLCVWREEHVLLKDQELFQPQDWSDAFKRFFEGTLVAMRMCLSALAPLEDDTVLTRLVLSLDMFFVAFRMVGWLAVLRFDVWGGWNLAERTVYCSATIRELVFLVLAIWAFSRRTAQAMQLWMWRAIGLFAFMFLLENLPFAAYQVVALHGQPAALLSAIINATVVCVVCRRDRLLGMQARVRRWAKVVGATSAAASIACLIGPGDAKKSLDQAKGRFCCVTLENISFEDVQDNIPDPGLHDSAKPCKLGHCDAFVSHSWHDDAGAKWAAMQSWRESFVQSHGREPRIWFDKFCIDQNHIQTDLRCLPIFLGGCERLVIFCGTTYLMRLWCVLEIFSYIMMGGRLSNVELVPVLAEGGDTDQMASLRESFEHFDASKCECFNHSDKQWMLTVIQTAFGDLPAFNEQVSSILRQLRRESRLWSDHDAPPSPARSSASSASPSSLGSGRSNGDGGLRCGPAHGMDGSANPVPVPPAPRRVRKFS